MRHGFIIICQKANGDQCSGSTCLHQALRNSSAGRGMVCVFWDRQEVVLENFMSWGHNVNASLLSVIVWSVPTSNLQKAVRSAAEKCHFQHDNDFCHTAYLSDSRENWTDGLGIVTTSAIQSRLSSKWFSFVWTTQGIVWRHCLRTIEEEVEQHVRKFLYDANKDFYATGFSWLAERWECCIELKGDHVEK